MFDEANAKCKPLTDEKGDVKKDSSRGEESITSY